MCHGQKAGSEIHRIRQLDQIERSKIHRLPRRSGKHLGRGGAFQEKLVRQNVALIGSQLTIMSKRTSESISISNFCLNNIGNCQLGSHKSEKPPNLMGAGEMLVGKAKSWRGSCPTNITPPPLKICRSIRPEMRH